MLTPSGALLAASVAAVESQRQAGAASCCSSAETRRPRLCTRLCARCMLPPLLLEASSGLGVAGDEQRWIWGYQSLGKADGNRLFNDGPPIQQVERSTLAAALGLPALCQTQTWCFPFPLACHKHQCQWSQRRSLSGERQARQASVGTAEQGSKVKQAGQHTQPSGGRNKHVVSQNRSRRH